MGSDFIACGKEKSPRVLGTQYDKKVGIALARSPREGNGYPLQDSCLENSMNIGAWQATVHGLAELDTTEQLTLSPSLSPPI